MIDSCQSLILTRGIRLWLSCLEVDIERPKGNPPDDNLGGMDARVGRTESCLCASSVPMPTVGQVWLLFLYFFR